MIRDDLPFIRRMGSERLQAPEPDLRTHWRFASESCAFTALT